MFLISKCRGDWDLRLCITLVLAFREPQRNDKIRFFLRRNTFFSFGSRHCASVLQTQVPKLCTDLDFSLLYISILGTCSKFIRKNNFLALGVCFPQPCSSAGRRFAASRSRLQNYQRIVSFSLVIQTGKSQPVFIWREKPVSLALLSNLTIAVPA